MAQVDVNVIRVGGDLFTADENTRIQDALIVMISIFAQVNLAVGGFQRFMIHSSKVPAYLVIDSPAEARALTSDWTVPNNALDMFVVRQMLNEDGRSPVGGPCNKNAQGMTGVVVSIAGSAANAGNTFAHEVGHYLGLSHSPIAGNFIEAQSNSNTAITAAQGTQMKAHCFVH